MFWALQIQKKMGPKNFELKLKFTYLAYTNICNFFQHSLTQLEKELFDINSTMLDQEIDNFCGICFDSDT